MKLLNWSEKFNYQYNMGLQSYFVSQTKKKRFQMQKSPISDVHFFHYIRQWLKPKTINRLSKFKKRGDFLAPSFFKQQQQKSKQRNLVFWFLANHWWNERNILLSNPDVFQHQLPFLDLSPVIQSLVRGPVWCPVRDISNVWFRMHSVLKQII